MSTETVQGFELSPQQKLIWSLRQQSRRAFYCGRYLASVRGELDPNVLAHALRSVVERHESLRTSFKVLPGMRHPLQVISPAAGFGYLWRDLTALPAEAQEALRRELLEVPLEADADDTLALNVTGMSFEPGRHLLMFEVSGLCADALSLHILAVQLRQAYLACLDGRQLPELPIQYADVAETLNMCLESEEFDLGRQFWREQVANSLTRLEVASEAVAADFRPRRLVAEVADAVHAMAEEFCARSGISREGLLLICWGLLRCRLAAADEVLLGVCCDGRTHDVLRDTVGVLSRQVPFLFRQQRGSAFAEAVRTVDRLCDEIKEEQHYFDPASLTANGATAGFAYDACFEYILLSADGGAEPPRFLTESLFSVSDRFLTKLTVIDGGAGLRLLFEYDASVVSESQVQKVSACFASLLESAVRDPGRRVEWLDLMSPAARLELLTSLRGTEARLETPFLHEIIARQSAAQPDRIALVFENRQLSYGELDRRADRLGHHLRRRGVSPDVKVGICMERALEMVIALVGVLKAGGAYVPLDPGYPPERLAYMLENSELTALLTRERLVARLPGGGAQVICMDAGWEKLTPESGTAGTPELAPQSLAYVIYTSGSTGQPKGVMIPHAAVCNHMLWQQAAFAISSEDVVLQKTPFGFDAAATEFFLPLMAGGRLVLARPEGHRDPAYLASAVQTEGVTILQVVPSMLSELMAGQPGLFARGPLRQVFSGGEPLAAELAAGVAGSGPAKLCNLYGPTESAIDVSYWEVPAGRSYQSVPIGGSIDNTQLYVLDSEMQCVPSGVAGEIYVGGTAVGRGYLERPDLTAERYVPDPLDGRGGRLYRTGDLGRISETGEVEYLGRIDQQVKLRGYRIELGEIESVLRRHAAVRQCAVTVRTEETGDQRLVAYFVPAGEEEPSAAELRAYLADTLPEYMLPSAFVELGELPLMPNGKLDRKALPAPTTHAPATYGESARTPVEHLVAGIFAEVLRRDDLGSNDNFFELGGHSLLATQVVSRLREVLGVDVPLRALFEHPVVAQLAEVVESEQRMGRGWNAPPMAPADRERELPLSFAQQGLWFIQQLEPESVAYNIPLAVRLQGQPAIAAICQSLAEIVRRHEVLRTRFVSRDGRPLQVIAAPYEVSVKLCDLSRLAEEQRAAYAREVAAEEAGRPFDLERGPVWRAILIRLAEEEHLLLICLHHIASDGWSTGLMVKEFTTFYEGYRAGHLSTLPQPPVQYADFALWQREWLRAEVLDALLDYWRQKLANLPASELPTDRPRLAGSEARESSLPFQLSTELTQALKAMGRREGLTLFMTLLAGFQLVLGRYAGSDEVIVGTDTANRNRLEIEGLIGFFVNQLVLRTDLSGNPSLRDLLRQVRATTLAAYVHQDLPFEKLVEELSPVRDRDRSPLFQVKLVLQNAPAAAPASEALNMAWIPVSLPVAKFDMLFNLIETRDGLLGDLSYRADLFTTGSVSRLLRMYEEVLHRFTRPESMDMSVGDLMSAIDVLLRSEAQEEQYHLFRPGLRADRRKPARNPMPQAADSRPGK